MAEGKPGYEPGPAITCRRATTSGSSGTSSSTGGRRGAIRTASSPRSSRAGTSPAGRSDTCTGRSRQCSGPCSRGTCSSCSASSARAASRLLAPGGRNATWSSPQAARVRDGAVPPGAVERGPPLAWIAMLLPLSLYGLGRREKDRTGGSPGRRRARLDPALGQLHLALGAIPFFAAYALVRCPGLHSWPCPLSARTARDALAVSARPGERPPVPAGRALLRERAGLPLARHARLEGIVYVGWTVACSPSRARRAHPAASLGIALVLARRADPDPVPLGGNLPGYHFIWEHVPGLRNTRSRSG
jgi:hypothetical protein